LGEKQSVKKCSLCGIDLGFTNKIKLKAELRGKGKHTQEDLYFCKPCGELWPKEHKKKVLEKLLQGPKWEIDFRIPKVKTFDPILFPQLILLGDLLFLKIGVCFLSVSGWVSKQSIGFSLTKTFSYVAGEKRAWDVIHEREIWTPSITAEDLKKSERLLFFPREALTQITYGSWQGLKIQTTEGNWDFDLFDGQDAFSKFKERISQYVSFELSEKETIQKLEKNCKSSNLNKNDKHNFNTEPLNLNISCKICKSKVFQHDKYYNEYICETCGYVLKIENIPANSELKILNTLCKKCKNNIFQYDKYYKEYTCTKCGSLFKSDSNDFCQTTKPVEKVVQNNFSNEAHQNFNNASTKSEGNSIIHNENIHQSKHKSHQNLSNENFNSENELDRKSFERSQKKIFKLMVLGLIVIGVLLFWFAVQTNTITWPF
jgi:hypothetical protein